MCTYTCVQMCVCVCDVHMHMCAGMCVCVSIASVTDPQLFTNHKWIRNKKALCVCVLSSALHKSQVD